jgi:hypothetical protein
MGLQNCRFHTDTALITVGMLRGSTNTTDPTLIAMVLPLVLVVQEDTYSAPIGTHDNATSFTDLVGLLFQRTQSTTNSLDGLAVHHMSLLDILFVLVLNLVMAKATRKPFATTGGQ